MGTKLLGIRIDIETKSSAPVKFGSYVYSESPDFEVLIVSYSPVRRYPGGRLALGRSRPLDLYDQQAVDDFAHMLRSPHLEKHAYNANFERVCLSRWLGMETGDYLDPYNWRCSAVRANVNGMFGRLDDVANAVRSPIKKDAQGARLIRLFSVPDAKDKPLHRFHEGSADCWCGADHTADFAAYQAYCNQDVMTEAGIAHLMPDIPEAVQREYEADQRINDRGFRHFKTLSQQAVAQVEVEKNRVMSDLKTLTGLANPNSGQQFKAWLEDQNYPMTSLDKDHRAEAITDPFIPDVVKEALELKGRASLTSVQKHQAALDTRCMDGRIRGSLQFYGAHTGREAGRGIQPQNLPRYEAPEADRKRLLRGVAGRDAATIAKGTVRASIVPARDHVFVTADYNAIEARVLGGLAGEKWVEDEFKVGQGKIYEATAATMFGVDKDTMVKALGLCGKCGKDSCQWCVLRGKGKISNLALGYGGGAGALVTMGAEAAGIDVGNYPHLNAEWKVLGMPGGKFHEWEQDRHDYPELKRLRDLYREASPATVRFWKLCAGAFDVASDGGSFRFGQNQMIGFQRDGRHNKMVLPSGRAIWYRFGRSHIDPDRTGSNGEPRIDRRTFIGKSPGVGHRRTDTHGGKLTENVTQAVARDLLFDLIMRIEAKTESGWPARIVFHVHDEVVLEVHKRHADQVLADTLGLMSQVPAWGKVFALKGEGKIMERYAK